MESFNIYMAIPRKFEHLSTIIVSKDIESAREKAYEDKNIKSVVDAGVSVKIHDISERITSMGYHVDISRSSVYH